MLLFFKPVKQLLSAGFAAVLAFGAITPANALYVQITSPANNATVTPGQVVSVTASAGGPAAGIYQLTVAGEVFTYGPFPPANFVTETAQYFVPANATNGQVLTITARVEGYADDPMNTSVNVIVQAGAPPANDNFANRATITGASGTASGSNVNATRETGEPYHASSTAGRSVWYTWTAPSNGEVTINTVGSAFDTVLAVYTGSSLGGLALVASNDDITPLTNSRSSVTFNATAATVYQIAVAGYFASDTGSIALTWNLTAPDPNILVINGYVGGTCFDEARNRLYVSNRTANRVDAYDLQTRTSVQNWTVTGARGMDISPDGSTLVVAGTNSITQINLLTNTVTGNTSTAGMYFDGNPTNVCYFGTDRVIVGLADGQWDKPLIYTPSTQLATNATSGPLSYGFVRADPHWLARSADYTKFAFCEGGSSSPEVYVLDQNLALVTSREMSDYGRRFTMNPEGTRIAGDLQVIDLQMNIVLEFPFQVGSTGYYTNAVQFLPGSKNVLVQFATNFGDASRLEIWSEETDGMVRTIPLPGRTDFFQAYLQLGKKTGNTQQVFLVEPTQQKVRILTIDPVTAADPDWAIYE